MGFLRNFFKTDEELKNDYEKERQKWIKGGSIEEDNNGFGTKKMHKINKEISRRTAKKWKNDPRRNKDPNFRWTDANRWDKD